MYNVGFGDCFLLTLPSGRRKRTILIDCGTHPSSTGSRTARDAATQIVRDISVDGRRPRIDVVIATHRHRDHVSGFDARELWDRVEVGEIWLPWTEDPRDAVATRLRERMSRSALALDRVRELMPASESVALAAAIIANSLANEKAMETLHDGFAGSPDRRFLSTQAEPLDVELLSNVKVHVLGPSREESVIRDLEPPRDESWMHDPELLPEPERRPPPPFDDDWAISWDEFHAIEDFAELRPGGQIVGAIRSAAGDDLLLAAASLEKSVNGTSLMLLFEIGDLFLLFPGDAQHGTWKAVLDDAERRRLVQRATFYKIGHHGSHNATPKEFVETLLAKDTWAALPFAPVKLWPSIPNADLLKAIEGKARVLRSDAPPAAGTLAGVTVREDISMDLVLATG